MVTRLALLIALAACAGDTAVTPRNEPGLRFVSAAIADTIDAVVAAPIELRVNDERGAPRGDVAVTVSGPEGVGVSRVASALGGQYLPSVSVTTDAAGRARVWVRLGTQAGREVLRAAAGADADSLVVDIRVGQPAQLAAAPTDTALGVGQTYQIRAQVLDRRKNPRTDPVSFSATGGGASVSASGVVSASAIGRATIVASLGDLRATVSASVVPPAVLAFYAEPLTLQHDGGIYVMRSDGSGGRWVFRFRATGSAPPPFGLWPTWSGDGARLAFTHAAGLRLVEADGSGLRDVVTGGPPVSNEFGLQYTKDRWIYFTRGEFGSQRTFWRVRDDGTGLAQVSERRKWGVEAMPTPSPTSDLVAYQTNDVTNSPTAFTLRFISASTGAIRKLDLAGYSPRWAPTGDKIGYLNGPNRLNFLDANGNPLGEVGGRVVPLQQGFSWSPDGAWVVGVGSAGGLLPVVQMVNTTSGLALQLPFRGPDGQLPGHPNWQPSR